MLVATDLAHVYFQSGSCEMIRPFHFTYSAQYSWQPSIKYRQVLDPTAEEVRKTCMTLRQQAHQVFTALASTDRRLVLCMLERTVVYLCDTLAVCLPAGNSHATR